MTESTPITATVYFNDWREQAAYECEARPCFTIDGEPDGFDVVHLGRVVCFSARLEDCATDAALAIKDAITAQAKADAEEHAARADEAWEAARGK